MFDMLIFIFFLSLLVCTLVWILAIEPNRISQSDIVYYAKDSHKQAFGLRIAHISDLHFKASNPVAFTNKIIKKLAKINPDIIIFSGDFICHAQLSCPSRLKLILSDIVKTAKIGAYCTYGNHDYNHYISRDETGCINIIQSDKPNLIRRIIKNILLSKHVSNKFHPKMTPIPINSELEKIVKESGFTILHNTSILLPIGITIIGLGDLMAMQSNPEIAFQNINHDTLNIIISHNPDSIPKIMEYNWSMVLSGHTHGQQIYISWPKFLKRMSEQLAGLENTHLLRGYVAIKEKFIYISRGLGALKRIRFNSTPEICVITIRNKS